MKGGSSARIVMGRVVGRSRIPIILSTSKVGSILPGVSIVGSSGTPIILAPRPNRVTQLVNSSITSIYTSEVRATGTFTGRCSYVVILGNTGAIIASKSSIFMGVANGPNVTVNNAKSVLANVVTSFVTRNVGTCTTTHYTICVRNGYNSVATERVDAHKVAVRSVLSLLNTLVDRFRWQGSFC